MFEFDQHGEVLQLLMSCIGFLLLKSADSFLMSSELQGCLYSMDKW